MHVKRLLYTRTKTSKSLENANTILLSNAKCPLKWMSYLKSSLPESEIFYALGHSHITAFLLVFL